MASSVPYGYSGAAEPVPRSPSSNGPPMSLSTVLVVDPDPTTLKRAEGALGPSTHAILGARTPDEALEAVQGVDVGLAIIAAGLPRGSGYALSEQLKDRWPAASVVLVTGGFEVFNRARADAAGVSAHLRRPFSEDALQSCVEGLLGPLQPVSTPIEPAPSCEPEAAAPAPVAAPAPAEPPALAPVHAPSPPVSDERFATFLPRDYADVPRVRVDPTVVGPAVERAILEVLPEVVESVLRHALGGSTAFRELVAASVDEAVRDALPEIAAQVVRERLDLLEARADAD